MREHVALQPAAGAGLFVVHLAAHPEAGEGTRLRVDMMRLHVVQELRVALVLLVALVPIADAVMPLRPLAACSCAGRKADRLGLRQNRRYGALGQHFAGALRQRGIHHGRGRGAVVDAVAVAVAAG